MDDFILSTQHNEKWYYWLGGGYFTEDPNQAKTYSFRQAESMCNRIKRWKMMYCTLDEEIERLAEEG